MKSIMLTLILVPLVLGAFTRSGGQESSADLVLVNGTIYTGDPALGRVEALAIKGEIITAAGTRHEIEHWVGPHTRVLDLQGRFVMPGFNDAHVHMASAGRAKLTLDFTGVRSLAEMQQRMRARLDDVQPGEWLRGHGWDQSLWDPPSIPTRQDLDAVSKDHPMLFSRVDGHSAVVNSLALELAGITKDTPEPEGGEIVRDPQGEPTGWLKEEAVGLVERLIPKPTQAQRKRALELALQDAAAHGVTSVQDDSVRGGDWENFVAYQKLQQEGKLIVRVTEWLDFNAPIKALKARQAQAGTADPWLKTGALKAITDGSGGSHTAAMLEPFADEPGNRGILLYEPEKLKQMVIERDAASFQIALHAIGDRANRVVLDAFTAARAANKRRDARHRIEHAQFVHPDDFKRFGELGVIASVQPCHLLSDMRWAPALLGPARAAEGYAFGTLLKSGAILAFGTDYPVELINPFRGLYAAVTREFETGGPQAGWLPEEKLTLEEAIHAYTLGSAYAEFEEQRKGTLTLGKFADLIVLSQDITRVPSRALLNTEVLLTVVGGKIVYEKK